MKNRMKKIFTAVIMCLIALMMAPHQIHAQALKGSYFLDYSLNRHKLNPAFAPRADYFQLFGVGNLGLGIGTNLDIPTFFYPKNGELLTFLHQDVSMKEFSRALPAHPHFDFELNTTLLGFGFYTKQMSYWTFDLGIKTLMDVDLPRDLFLFAKKGTGTAHQSFNIGNINAYAMAAMQASLGYSRNFPNGFRGGIKVRVLAPFAYMGLNVENLRLNTSTDKWTLQTEGYAQMAVQGLMMSSNEQGVPSPQFDIQRMLQNGVVSGWGGSIDLGVEYTLETGSAVDGLSVSAAVTDLGAIYYDAKAVASYKSQGKIEWTGFQDVAINGSDFEASLNEFVENAKKELLNLTETETSKGLLRSTMPTLYVGAELPFLKRSMSVGVLYSCRFSHSYPRHELTFSYNITPCKWFALGVNYSVLNTTRTLGAILEITPKAGPSLFIGADYIPVSWTKAPLLLGNGSFNAIPLSYRLNLHFGIAMHVGSKYLKK